jgi:A/G-specific adenine glycosylase
MTGRKLIDWYEVNKRNLPWRETSDPYAVWVSEIILQQTRVSQGMDYFYRFMEFFPDIFSLAQAKIDDVLKVWQGLGYYSRARNMHIAAKQIAEQCRGQFPDNYHELMAIKGIGDYTASAIASIAFGQAVPVVDGNVNRVIARLFGVQQPVNKPEGKQLIRENVEKLMIRDAPALFNQAIMEFGALQCVPHNPDCENCILKHQCTAYRAGLVNILPVKAKTLKTRTRYFHYIVIFCENTTYLHRRAEGDIWTGLYEFPLIETEEESGFEEITAAEPLRTLFQNNGFRLHSVSAEITRRLTHRILKIRFYEVSVDNSVQLPEYNQVRWADIHRYAVPKVIDNYLKQLKMENGEQRMENRCTENKRTNSI